VTKAETDQARCILAKAMLKFLEQNTASEKAAFDVAEIVLHKWDAAISSEETLKQLIQTIRKWQQAVHVKERCLNDTVKIFEEILETVEA
jgi:pyruvate kinase